MACKVWNKINKDLKIGCMICYMCTYPLTCNPEDMLLAQGKDNLNNFLCSDVQVRGAYHGFAKRYFKENNIKIAMEKDDETMLKQGCVDFYTFSYYMSNCISADPDKQQPSGKRNKKSLLLLTIYNRTAFIFRNNTTERRFFAQRFLPKTKCNNCFLCHYSLTTTCMTMNERCIIYILKLWSLYFWALLVYNLYES